MDLSSYYVDYKIYFEGTVAFEKSLENTALKGTQRHVCRTVRGDLFSIVSQLKFELSINGQVLS